MERPGATAPSARFNYQDSDAELANLAASIGGMLAPQRRTHVIFNNNMEDQGQRNARTMMAKLGLADVGP